MKLKTEVINGTTYAVIQGDKPVYIEDDGKEVAFDAPGTRSTISRINGEAKGHREAKEAAEAKLKAFEGIADPAAALKALETIKNIDDKKLVDAGHVERIKSETAKAFEERIAAMSKTHADEIAKITGERDGIQSQYHAATIGQSFTGSKLIADKFLIPADLAQAKFGTSFKIEDGKVVGYDAAGNKIFSKSRPGELAGFDEALEILVDSYSFKDNILKGRGGGSGAGGSGAGGGGDKKIARSEFEKLSPVDKAAKMKEGFTLADA